MFLTMSPAVRAMKMLKSTMPKILMRFMGVSGDRGGAVPTAGAAPRVRDFLVGKLRLM